MLDSKIRLRCRGILEVFCHRQGEGQDWSETGKRLIVKTLTPELILSRRCDTRRDRITKSCAQCCIRTLSAANGPLEHLRRIQKYRPAGGRIDRQRTSSG